MKIELNNFELDIFQAMAKNSDILVIRVERSDAVIFESHSAYATLKWSTREATGFLLPTSRYVVYAKPFESVLDRGTLTLEMPDDRLTVKSGYGEIVLSLIRDHAAYEHDMAKAHQVLSWTGDNIADKFSAALKPLKVLKLSSQYVRYTPNKAGDVHLFIEPDQSTTLMNMSEISAQFSQGPKTDVSTRMNLKFGREEHKILDAVLNACQEFTDMALVQPDPVNDSTHYALRFQCGGFSGYIHNLRTGDDFAKHFLGFKKSALDIILSLDSYFKIKAKVLLDFVSQALAVDKECTLVFKSINNKQIKAGLHSKIDWPLEVQLRSAAVSLSKTFIVSGTSFSDVAVNGGHLKNMLSSMAKSDVVIGIGGNDSPIYVADAKDGYGFALMPCA